MGKLVNKKAKVDLSRPSIDLTPTNRIWKDIEIRYISEGDIIAEKGTVVWVGTTCNNQIAFEAGIPESKDYFMLPDEIVKAFVKRDGAYGS